MATRSAICIANKDRSLTGIYCHWDGYPEHQMPILKEHYNNATKTRRLIAGGHMSSLRTKNMWDPNGGGYICDVRKPQPLYHKERTSHDMGDTAPIRSENIQTACKEWREWDCEVLYIYDLRKGWSYIYLR